jgi:O-antigen/teichoic acid export membrane protein
MMAELQGSHVDMRNTLLRILRLVACTSFPMCIGLMLVAHDLVKVFLDEKWMPIVPMIQILALYAVIRSQDVFLPPVLLARYRAQFLFGYTLMLLGVMSLAFWAGAVWFGSIGVSAVWVVVYPLAMAYMAREAFKELDLRWKIVLRQMQMVVIATLSMVAIVLPIQWVISGSDAMSSLVRLSLSFAVGAVTYGLVMLLWDRKVLNELREVVTWVFQPKKRAMAGK